MKKTILILLLIIQALSVSIAQERSVKVDFESGSFYNNPKIPFDEPFVIFGETGSDIEFVKANIYYEGKNFILHSFVWNRNESNHSETFNIVVPPILRSNTKYAFEIITYKVLSNAAKDELLKNVQERIRFLLMNNIYFDGGNVVVNKPKDVFNKIKDLIEESFGNQESKNSVQIQAPSALVLDELIKQKDFRLKRIFRRTTRDERNDAANQLASEKVEHLVNLISSELTPFLNSQLVQHHRMAKIKSVETDKEPFTLPVNFGLYAWDKAMDVNDASVHNINFTPALGITIPFKNKSKLIQKTRLLDSFGVSAGVLFQPVVDNKGNEYVTPGINLPVYAGLGLRVFKVVRFNAGVLVIGEKGEHSFKNLTFLPTAGLALELNLWMGVK
jgi:hypothetical protein